MTSTLFDWPAGRWLVGILRAAIIGYAGLNFQKQVIAFKSTTAKGPSGALIELADTGWGKVLLWVIAIGLFAYGIFCFAEAKYRKGA